MSYFAESEVCFDAVKTMLKLGSHGVGVCNHAADVSDDCSYDQHSTQSDDDGDDDDDDMTTTVAMINTPLSRSTMTNANSELVSGAGTSPIVISTIVDQ